MSTRKESSNGYHETKPKSSFYFPQEFRDHLENLVFEILKEKPRDPLEYAFNFFSEQLKIRGELVSFGKITETEKEVVDVVQKQQDISRRVSMIHEEQYNKKENSKTTVMSNSMSETEAATIIQAYFRGFAVRQKWWKRRYLKISLNYSDHLTIRRGLDSPRGSFSLCWPRENMLAITDDESEESVDS